MTRGEFGVLMAKIYALQNDTLIGKSNYDVHNKLVDLCLSRDKDISFLAGAFAYDDVVPFLNEVIEEYKRVAREI